jgi:hypothetical protein
VEEEQECILAKCRHVAAFNNIQRRPANLSSICGMRCKSAKTLSGDFERAIAVQLGAIRDTIYWIVKKRLDLHVLAFGKAAR